VDERFVRLIQSLPEWEQDALRRFLLKGSLGHEDDARSVVLITRSLGIEDSSDEPPALPVSPDVGDQVIPQPEAA